MLVFFLVKHVQPKVVAQHADIHHLYATDMAIASIPGRTSSRWTLVLPSILHAYVGRDIRSGNELVTRLHTYVDFQHTINACFKVSRVATGNTWCSSWVWPFRQASSFGDHIAAGLLINARFKARWNSGKD